MTRIVAGAARGRRLKVPAALTRPTSDRVREAIFSSLASLMDLDGIRVLDLYAGSGALGLEAASRGASEVTLVDNSAAAARVLADNAAVVGLPGVRVERAAVADFLAGSPVECDLVFLDPPYALAAEQVTRVLAALRDGWLAPEAVVVVERGRDGEGLSWPLEFGDRWHRRFGDTHVLRAVWYGHEQVQT